MKIGDVVYLKSGSPALTVSEEPSEPNCHEGLDHYAVIPEACLIETLEKSREGI